MPTEVPGKAADVQPDALVIRFRPTDPESVLNWAAKAHRDCGRYLLSVFADKARHGESDADLRKRLLDAAGISGLDLANQKKYYVCTQAKELLDRGFAFTKDEDDDEMVEHYSVDLGTEPTLEDVTRFLDAFPVEERLS